MMPFHGKVMRDGRVILDDVDGELEEMTIVRNAKDWHGYFVVPSGMIPPPTGGPYNLLIDDGRSGTMQIGRVSPGSHQASVLHFEGNGPLRFTRGASH
jgi:hypothetical protein